jgi:HD domain
VPLTKANVLTDRFDRALLYAIHVHGGQVRKGTSTPYVAHLLAVAATVLEYGGDEDLAIAALLHDSVEDQGGKARLDDVRNRFGEGVARIVEACSDSLADTGKGERKAHWQERKEAYLAHLRTADEDILWVSLADKVHNARAILRDLRKPDIGEKVWARFNVSTKQTLWYYRSLADIFCERLSNQLSNELREIVEVLEAEVAKAASSGERLDVGPPAHETEGHRLGSGDCVRRFPCRKVRRRDPRGDRRQVSEAHLPLDRLHRSPHRALGTNHRAVDAVGAPHVGERTEKELWQVPARR